MIKSSVATSFFPLFLAVLAFSLAPAGAARAADDDKQTCIVHNRASLPPATLDVEGRASISIAPDIAHMNAGVVTTAPTAKEAMAENREKMNAVFAALKDAGIESKDIQSSSINISPQYRYEKDKAPTVTGYQASNTVNIVVRNLEDIGPVIDALIAQGVNQMSGPRFDVEDRESALNKARGQAVKAARARADIYAEAADIRLGRILKISESSASMPGPFPVMRAMAMSDSVAESAPTPVAAGEIQMDVNVSITFQIIPR